jgi:hypothetical protein
MGRKESLQQAVMGRGATGGGAGGTIWVRADNISIGNVSALGKIGGTTGDNEVGGKGGDGRIRLDYNIISGNSEPDSGYNGTLSDMAIISNESNATPFYLFSSNPLSCGELFAGDSCNLTWTMNTTGEIDSNWVLLMSFLILIFLFLQIALS